MVGLLLSSCGTVGHLTHYLRHDIIDDGYLAFNLSHRDVRAPSNFLCHDVAPHCLDYDGAPGFLVWHITMFCFSTRRKDGLMTLVLRHSGVLARS